MTTMQARRYEMLVRIRDFGKVHADLFPNSSLAREQFAAIGAAVKELSAHAVKRMLGAREGTASKAAARNALRDRLEALALTARAMAQTAPGLEDKLRVPNPSTDQALLTAGRLFAQEAEPVKGEFIRHALPKTFIADLTTLVDEFEDAIRDRSTSKAESAAAHASIKTALAAGNAAALRLDAMVTNHLVGDPMITAMWKRERRVHRPRRHVAVAPGPAAASVETQVSTSSASQPVPAPPAPPDAVPAPASAAPEPASTTPTPAVASPAPAASQAA